MAHHGHHAPESATRQSPKSFRTRRCFHKRGGGRMAFVELSQLSKTYGKVTVVDRVSLAIEKGALVCLLGPSGCGKTTTLRLVAGFVDPTAGEIRVGGRLLSAPDV